MEQKKQRAATKRAARKTTSSASAAGATMARETGPLPSTAPAINEEAVRTRAYYLYLERGGTPGRELDDWLQAERELRTLHLTA